MLLKTCPRESMARGTMAIALRGTSTASTRNTVVSSGVLKNAASRGAASQVAQAMTTASRMFTVATAPGARLLRCWRWMSAAERP
jgi:hypothetical protein